jgi:hypothetical protein
MPFGLIFGEQVRDQRKISDTPVGPNSAYVCRNPRVGVGAEDRRLVGGDEPARRKAASRGLRSPGGAAYHHARPHGRPGFSRSCHRRATR